MLTPDQFRISQIAGTILVMFFLSFVQYPEGSAVRSPAPESTGNFIMEPLERYAEYCDAAPAGKESHWLHHMACEKSTDVLLVLFTGVLAVATTYLVLVGILQQLESRDTARRELRAYIGVKSQAIRLLLTGRYQAVVTISNSGQTPAHKVRRSLDVGVGNTADFYFAKPQLSGQMPMAPNAEWELRQVLWDLAEDDERIGRIAVADSELRAFAWGRIEYVDIYGRPCSTTFRFETREVAMEFITTTDGRRLQRVSGWALSPTEEGNEAT